jgi:hypothetical protein
MQMKGLPLTTGAFVFMVISKWMCDAKSQSERLVDVTELIRPSPTARKQCSRSTP